MPLPAQVAQAQQEAEDLMKEMKAPAVEQEEEKQVEASDDPNSETWKQRYEVLSGKYNAEIVPFKDNVDILNKLKSDLRAAQTQLKAALQNNDQNARLISELRTELENKKPAVPAEIPVSWEEALTDEEKNHLEMQDLDDNTMRILTKVMNNVAAQSAPKYDEKLKEIDQRVQDVGKRVVETEMQTWDQKVRGAVPEFEKYFGDSADPKFVAWLDSPITPEADILNRDILQRALNNQDLERVKAGIKRFQNEVVPQKQRRNPIESQIEPAERFHGTTTGKDKTIYTEAEVDKFYLDQTKGVWKGREKEAAILNNKFLVAAKEGRIR